MGETLSQLGSREDENKSMLPSGPACGSKAASYSSTTTGSKPSCSCAPRERAAGGSFATCPTCQGSGEIPRGEWPQALEVAGDPGKALSSQLASARPL